MNKRNYIIRMILEAIIIIGCIILSALCYDNSKIFGGVCWNITGLIWCIDLGYNINTLARYDYMCFLEFMTYNYMQKIKTESGEINGKQTHNSEKCEGK